MGGILVYICSSFRPSFRNTFSSKLSPKLLKIETSYLVYRLTMTSCIVGLRMSFLLCFSLYLSFFLSLHIFRQRYLHNCLHKKFIFCMQVDNDKLYRGKGNGPSPFCSSLYMFTFLSLHAFSTVIFRQR